MNGSIPNVVAPRIKRTLSQLEYYKYYSEIRKSWLATFGIIWLFLIVLMAVFPEAIAPYDPQATAIENSLAGPSVEHPLGTDQFGRDVLSRAIFGARVSVLVGFLTVVIAGSIGIPMGVIAGYFGGWIEDVIMRIVDGILSFPSILLAFVIVALLGSGIFNVIFALGLIYSTSFARVARGSTLAIMENEFIEGAKASGASKTRIMTRHILPNIAGPLVVEATLAFAFAILDESAFSYLGLGAQPPTVSWGMMIKSGQEILTLAPWVSTASGVFIILSVLSYNALGDTLRDILDPHEVTVDER